MRGDIHLRTTSVYLVGVQAVQSTHLAVGEGRGEREMLAHSIDILFRLVSIFSAEDEGGVLEI